MRSRVAFASILAASAVVIGVGSGFRTAPAPTLGRLMAFDLQTGKTRFDVPTATPSAFIHTVATGAVTVTGAADCRQGHLQQPLMSAYATSTGAPLWQRAVSLYLACGGWGPVPASAGTVPVQTRAGLEGWAMLDGRTRWRDPEIPGWPLVGSDAALAIATPHAGIDLIDGATGEVRRTLTVHSGPDPFLLTARTAIVRAHSGTVAPRSRIVAFDRASGRRIWQRTLPDSFSPSGASDGIAIISWQTVPGYVADPSELTSTAQPEQTLTSAAFDIRTGRRLWSRRLPLATSPLALAPFHTGAGLAVYVDGRTLEALDLHTGVVRWQAKLARWKVDGGGDSISAGAGSVAVSDGTDITVFDARTGSRRWSRTVARSGISFFGPVALSGDQLLVSATSTAFVPFSSP